MDIVLNKTFDMTVTINRVYSSLDLNLLRLLCLF